MGHEAGKGSKQRPTNHEAYSKSWDTIFRGKKESSSSTPPVSIVEAAMPEQSTQTEATAFTANEQTTNPQ